MHLFVHLAPVDEDDHPAPEGIRQIFDPETPHTVYTSAWHTANARTTSVAYLRHGFSKGIYNLPSAPGANDDYITADLQWWSGGGAVEGYMNISYDHYKLKRGTTTHVYSNACPQDF